MEFIQLLCILAVSIPAYAAWPTVILPDRDPDCEDWVNRPFADTKALGIWYLLHFKANNETGEGLNSVVRFLYVPVRQRHELEMHYSRFVRDVDWHGVVLKMQLPCPWGVDEHYLEKLKGDGYYRTLTLSFTGLSLPHENHGRYPIRMTMVANKFLGMMDCYNNFVSLLGRHPEPDRDTDVRLHDYIASKYWPLGKDIERHDEDD